MAKEWQGARSVLWGIQGLKVPGCTSVAEPVAGSRSRHGAFRPDPASGSG